jgi:SAM-dependent methyltransferase
MPPLLPAGLHRVLSPVARAIDFNLASRSLLRGSSLTREQKKLVSAVDLRTHPNDGMYRMLRSRHYLGVGLSAIDCIDAVWDGPPPKRVLDLPCGHGRVLRFLKARFPGAEITACEIDGEAADFCGTQFGAEPVYSCEETAKIPINGEFDLIWCGSLLTHLMKQPSVEILRFFHDHLSSDGVCIFTTQGETSANWIDSGLETYGIPREGRDSLVASFRSSGYGYANYDGQPSYGVSLLTEGEVKVMAAEAGRWHQVLFVSHGWDNHQDVHGFSKSARPVRRLARPIPPKRAGSWTAAY